jgi:hypothetical protein
MSQMPSNAPIMESKPGPAGWLPVWIKAVTQPNEQTFIDITSSSDATTRTAFIWVFIAGTVAGILQAISRAIILAIGGVPQMPIPGMEQFMQQSGGTDPAAIGVSLITGLCLSPVAGLVSILFFAIGVAIVQWIAKLFGGVGTFEKLAYALAAITVPFTLVSSIFSLFSAIPFVGICTGIISLGLSLYAIVLQITAIKAVNRFGWGPAIGSALIPGAVLLFVCGCIVVGGLMLLGPTIGNVFSEINQSLQSVP